MICPHCHSEVPDGKKFCGICGKPIPATETTTGVGGDSTNVIEGDLVRVAAPEPHQPAVRLAREKPEKDNISGASCPKCGNALPPGSQFCNVCGHNLAASHKDERCPKCKRDLAPGSKVCSYCGHKLSRQLPRERLVILLPVLVVLWGIAIILAGGYSESQWYGYGLPYGAHFWYETAIPVAIIGIVSLFLVFYRGRKLLFPEILIYGLIWGLFSLMFNLIYPYTSYFYLLISIPFFIFCILSLFIKRRWGLNVLFGVLSGWFFIVSLMLAH